MRCVATAAADFSDVSCEHRKYELLKPLKLPFTFFYHSGFGPGFNRPTAKTQTVALKIRPRSSRGNAISSRCRFAVGILYT